MPPRPRRRFVSAIERKGSTVKITPKAPLFIDRKGRPVSMEQAKKWQIEQGAKSSFILEQKTAITPPKNLQISLKSFP